MNASYPERVTFHLKAAERYDSMARVTPDPDQAEALRKRAQRERQTAGGLR